MPDWQAYVREHLPLRGVPSERASEIVDEIAEQLEEAYQEAVESGLSDSEATLAAKRHIVDWPALGNDLLHAGLHSEPQLAGGTRHRQPMNPRAQRPGSHVMRMAGGEPGMAVLLDSLRQDFHYAIRMLLKRPLFTISAVLTIAIGIAANTAIFSVVNAVLLRPLPYPDSNRLAVVWSKLGKENRAPSSGPELISLRERSQLFDQFSGIWVQDGALTGVGEPQPVKLGWVTADFLSLLNTRPELGRFFLPGEEGTAAPVVVLSHEFWRRNYASDPRLIGRTVTLSGRLCTVVGVLPEKFKLMFPDGASVPPSVDVFAPFRGNLARQSRTQGYLRIVGRLRNGVTVQQGQAELDSIATQLRSQFGDYAEQDLHLQAFSLQGDVARNVRPALLALFASTIFVLLIACANVAVLLLSRANERASEMTVRAALGATSGRIIRQLLTESVLLACVGGALALPLSWGILAVLWRLQPAGIARSMPTGSDIAVLGFNVAISVACGVLFGLSPAFEAKAINLAGVMREASRTATGRRHASGRFLIAGEVALTFALMTGAVLLIRTFVDVLHVDPGFDPQNVLTFHVSLPGVRYPTPEKAVGFIRDAQRSVSEVPGVESVGVVSHLPFDDSLPNWYDYFWREGAPQEEQNTFMADHRSVLPSFFDSVGARFVAGRNFNSSDEVANRKVAIIDESIATQLWPNGDAIGKSINIENGSFNRDVAEVVGVVRHVQFHSLTNPVRPQVYLPYRMAIRANMSFTVRSKASPASLVPMIRQQIANLDKDLPVANVRMMDDYVAGARLQARFVAVLCGSLGAIALLLSCIGIYGVTSAAVLRRTKEIGVRMALGAQRHSIVWMVLRASMPPVILGGIVGFWLSIGAAPLLSSLLYGVKPISAPVLLSVLAFLCVVGLIASFLPTQRVIFINPIVALRCE